MKIPWCNCNNLCGGMQSFSYMELPCNISISSIGIHKSDAIGVSKLFKCIVVLSLCAFGPSLRFAVTHHRYDMQRSVGCCSDFMEFGLDLQSMYLALHLREILLTNWKASETHTHTYREIRSTFLPPIIPWVFASRMFLGFLSCW